MESRSFTVSGSAYRRHYSLVISQPQRLPPFKMGFAVHIGTSFFPDSLRMDVLTCSCIRGSDCTGGASLLPSVPVFSGESVPNLFNVAGLVAEAARCFQTS